MRRLITFSGEPYEETTREIVERSPQFGVDDITVYDDKWLLTQDFYRQNQWLWEHPHKRGFGWYAWKPYIIWHALSESNVGDIVLYVDADTYPVAPLNPLFEQCQADGGIMLFASEGHRQHEWCKQDCYIAMGQFVEDMPAGVARFMLFEKGPWRTTQFLMEWLTYCVNPTCNTFDPSQFGELGEFGEISEFGEHEGFIEHRAEQAIMTNLAHKYGLKLYREVCEAGNSSERDRDLYGQLFKQANSDVAHVSAQPYGSIYANA